MHNAADYQQQLNALLPPGVLWEALRQDETAQALLLALADEFARLDGRATELLKELDPRTTYELLDEWEAFAGLPDTCTGTQEQLSERQESLHEKLTGIGGQSRQYFIALAARLGYTITIDEFSIPDVNADANIIVYGIAWAYAWRVNGPLNQVTKADANMLASEPLATWATTALECVIRRLAPAHTVPIFAYA